MRLVVVIINFSVICMQNIESNRHYNTSWAKFYNKYVYIEIYKDFNEQDILIKIQASILCGNIYESKNLIFANHTRNSRWPPKSNMAENMKITL